MKMTLTKKLSLGFLFAIMGSLIITSIISNSMISKKFNQYLMNEHETKMNEMIRFIEDSYNKNIGFSSESQESISRNASMNELYVEIRDINDNKIFSSGTSYLQHSNMMNSMMGRGRNMMGKQSNITPGKYKEENHNLIKDSKKIGTIIIGYYGTSYFSSNSLSFINTLNHSFFISFFITLLLGLLISFFLSKQIASPLIKITKTAVNMRMGNLQVRSNVKSSTKEIQELADSINYLAKTLNQQEKLRKRLTSDMAHEIRTPLTTLKTHVEALIDGIWEPTEERLKMLYEELTRLSKLVDNLRDLSKLEHVGVILNKSKINLSDELIKLVDTFSPMYIKRNFSIITEVTENVIVLMDKDMLKQIIYNLLSNSYKYLNDGGKVIVSLYKSIEYIVIDIKDTGTGISEKDLPNIFERFYRSDISRNKHTGGSGLGLTITKSLVEAHGGKIEVKSKFGEGTTFSIKFPKKICIN
ncbi:ATP-binding protein [Haloimpatiens sp. FM7330]|uniref:HAMP domain-containing sensor histidine kinase n=1 Tax=Haloimpatiens sp. FM7330 TaxID=3298610 RepID=UPI003638635F